MLMPLTVALALLPATSVAVPLTDWPAPSMRTAAGSGQLATPDRLSLQVKLTVTSVLFQPFAFGAGLRAAVIVGGVLSILTAGEVKVALFPARSATVTVPVTAPPSAV